MTTKGRNTPAGCANPEFDYRVFINTIAIDQAKSVSMVRLPNNANIHIFAMAFVPAVVVPPTTAPATTAPATTAPATTDPSVAPSSSPTAEPGASTEPATQAPTTQAPTSRRQGSGRHGCGHRQSLPARRRLTVGDRQQ
ncbi:MAG: hypothetical protein ABI563_10995 [Specibacter sp.]